METDRMLPAVLALGIVFFCLTLWCSVTVARMRDIPTWRRFLPLCLFLLSNGASLLRAFDVPQVAEIVAFPLNLAVVLSSLWEFRGRRLRRRSGSRTADPAEATR
jgi:hypothetical protein